MKLIYSILVLILSYNSYGQDTAKAFTYGGEYEEKGSSLIQTLDKGFIIVGTTSSFGNGGADIYILKVDSSYSYQWSKVIGNEGEDVGKDVIQDSSGNIIVAGFSNHSVKKGYDGYLIKLTPNGNLIWEEKFGEFNWDFATSLKLKNDGNYIIIGNSQSYQSIGSDGWILEVDTSGLIKINETYGSINDDEYVDIEFFNNQYFCLGNNSKDIFFHIFNDNLQLLDSINVEIPAIQKGTDFIFNSDSVIVLTGTTNEYDLNYSDVFLLFLNLDFSIISEVVFKVKDYQEESYKIIQKKNKEYNLLALTARYGSGAEDIHFYNLNKNGHFLSSRQYGSNYSDIGADMILLENGEKVILGYSNGLGNGGYNDLLLIETDSIERFGATHPHIPMVDSTYEIITKIRIFEKPYDYFKTYPNPASQFQSINIQSSNENYHFDIIDSFGRLIFKNLKNTSIFFLETPGIYFLKGYDEKNKFIETKKMIVTSQ